MVLHIYLELKHRIYNIKKKKKNIFLALEKFFYAV